jgi:hypothetical protein
MSPVLVSSKSLSQHSGIVCLYHIPGCLLPHASVRSLLDILPCVPCAFSLIDYKLHLNQALITLCLINLQSHLKHVYLSLITQKCVQMELNMTGTLHLVSSHFCPVGLQAFQSLSSAPQSLLFSGAPYRLSPNHLPTLWAQHASPCYAPCICSVEEEKIGKI